MGSFPGGKNILSYLGSVAKNPPEQIIAQRAPTATDNEQRVGTLWADETTGFPYQLTRVIEGVATWSLLGSASSGLQSITGNTGGAVPADGLSNITITGETAQGISVAGTILTNSLQITAVDATTALKGVVTRATDAEVIAGTDATKYITAANVKAKLGVQTAETIPVSTGDSTAFGWLGPLTNGQLIVGNTGTTPVVAALTAGTGVSIVNGPGTITIAAAGLPWWTDVDVSKQMEIDYGYIPLAGTLATLTLPVTGAVGDRIRVIGSGVGGWKIAQNAAQLIRFGSSVSTTGVGGYIASTNRYDVVELICTVTDTTWNVVSNVGIINVV